MCETTRRLLALLQIIERPPPPYVDQVAGDDAVLDAWFGRHSAAFGLLPRPELPATQVRR